jgi:hypothetical protein
MNPLKNSPDYSLILFHRRGKLPSIAAKSGCITTMTETQILEILKDSKGLYSLANQFRINPDVSELMVLLNSSNDNVVEVGAWISGEILIAKENAQPVVFRLRQLANHSNPSIRFHAIGALFPLLDPADPATREMLIKLSHDSNKGVRLSAEAALKRLS